MLNSKPPLQHLRKLNIATVTVHLGAMSQKRVHFVFSLHALAQYSDIIKGNERAIIIFTRFKLTYRHVNLLGRR